MFTATECDMFEIFWLQINEVFLMHWKILAVG